MRRSGISETSGQSVHREVAEDASGAESPAIRLNAEEMRVLEAWLAAPDTLQSVVRRGSIIREAARGRSNSAIARELAVSRATIILWRRRFAREGILSLSEVRPGRGRRRSVSTRTVRAIVEAARRGSTASGRGSSARHLAEQSGVSAATVYRLWDAHGVRLDALGATPDRSQERAAGALLGIYLDPPDRVIALRGGEPRPLLQCGVVLMRALSGALDRFDRCAVGDGRRKARPRLSSRSRPKRSRARSVRSTRGRSAACSTTCAATCRFTTASRIASSGSGRRTRSSFLAPSPLPRHVKTRGSGLHSGFS